MNNLIPAIFRTGVPIIYAILIKLGISHLGLPDAVVTDVATVALSVLLYAALRGLEAVEPKLGWLLGWAKQPQYADMVGNAIIKLHPIVGEELGEALEKVRTDIIGAIEEKVAEALKPTTAAKKAVAKKTTARKGA